MKPKEQEETERNPDSFRINLFDIPDEALTLYFEMASQQSAIDQEEIPERFGLSKAQSKALLKQLVSSGLVRRNPDKSYEAIAPIEAVVSVLLAVRNLLRQLRETFPEQLTEGVPRFSEKVQREIETIPDQITNLRAMIESDLDSALSAYQVKAEELQNAPTFEEFIENLQTTVLKQVEYRLDDVRGQLVAFESIDSFTMVLNKLKIDVFDIVSISLSDMRERAFRLHELEEFRETLAELWTITPTLVGRHLTTFEQEMKTLEDSLSELFETKYRLGALKGVMENFYKEHIMIAVKNLKKSFQLSLTETIQGHLKTAQERFEKASKAALEEFEKLREQLANWVKNALDLAFSEVIRRNQEAASNLAIKMQNLASTFQETLTSGLSETVSEVKYHARELDKQIYEFASQIPQLRQKEFTPKLDVALQRAERKLDKVATSLPKNYQQWRSNFLQTTEKEVKSFLDEAETQVTSATHSLTRIWRRSTEVEPASFDLYRFVNGEEEFRSQFTSLVARAQRHLFIIVPRAKPLRMKLLNIIPREVQIRLVVSDPPSTAPIKRLAKKATELANLQIRHDPRGDVWGILRDYDEVLIGNSSKGVSNIVGITSSHEDHVELFRSIMETRWLHARPLNPPSEC